MDDLISRKAVIDKAITIPIAKIVTEDKVIYRRIVFVEDIENLPSAQPDITPDGTLKVTVEADIANVGRILLSQTGTQRGGLYYKDDQPEPKWIPCVDGNEPKANAECWISTNAKYVRRASYAPKADNHPNGFIVTVGSFGFYEYGKSAKAWMPYTKEPEPYREEGNE